MADSRSPSKKQEQTAWKAGIIDRSKLQVQSVVQEGEERNTTDALSKDQ